MNAVARMPCMRRADPFERAAPTTGALLKYIG